VIALLLEHGNMECKPVKWAKSKAHMSVSPPLLIDDNTLSAVSTTKYIYY